MKRLEKRLERLEWEIEQLWPELSEPAHRMVYVRAARRVLPITEAFFPGSSLAREAVELAELAILDRNLLNNERWALIERYKTEGPTMRDAPTITDKFSEEEYYRRLAAIHANEVCLHSLSWNLVDYKLKEARNSFILLADQISEVERQLADTQRLKEAQAQSDYLKYGIRAI